MYSKIYDNAKEALSDITDGSTIMSGGFGLCGIPENSINYLSTTNLKDLKVVSNNIGNSGRGLVKLLKKNMISKGYCSYVGGNPDLEEAMLSGKIEIELIPQGTLSERIRAAGMGIRAFYTPTGYGTEVAEGKDIKEFDRPCILEHALHADFAIIKAQKADPYGNLWFKETARNFSPLMAMAAKTTIVEVEEIVALGDIRPEDVHIPGVFVQRVYLGSNYENAIEFLKVKE
ncbi:MULTISPECIES: CoA transferase subunit A [Halobacteriovorax]|uniref:CoA transferase subunit A n=1 Tax=Halobacteriovorax vibrionivorans TaxID=2152716 RepID=A0ABY0ICU6_9BACT|nr:MULTISPECIES: CoA transferase subunit A [Halobacteriovorax]RZF20445.1 CoA transferase subunit A [Halobacteriovorax vibrionivorans]TGD46618.1 CoA transferase subunit A [Halobacteriovorax sp. Y22]